MPVRTTGAAACSVSCLAGSPGSSPLGVTVIAVPPARLQTKARSKLTPTVIGPGADVQREHAQPCFLELGDLLVPVRAELHVEDLVVQLEDRIHQHLRAR